MKRKYSAWSFSEWAKPVVGQLVVVITEFVRNAFQRQRVTAHWLSKFVCKSTGNRVTSSGFKSTDSWGLTDVELDYYKQNSCRKKGDVSKEEVRWRIKEEQPEVRAGRPWQLRERKRWEIPESRRKGHYSKQQGISIVRTHHIRLGSRRDLQDAETTANTATAASVQEVRQ